MRPATVVPRSTQIPERITRGQLERVCAALGLDHTRTSRLEITPDRVEATILPAGAKLPVTLIFAVDK